MHIVFVDRGRFEGWLAPPQSNERTFKWRLNLSHGLMSDHGQFGDVRRITWIGLIVNLALSTVKLAIGWFGKSQATFADGIHSLSDCSTDVAILVGVRYWAKPPDESHPYGHRRIETAIASLIGVVLAVAGLGLIGNAARMLMSSGHRLPAPSPVALFALVASVISKEILYRWTVSVGKRTASPAVIANAWHHRSDALSSIPAAGALAVIMVSPEWAFLDRVAAIVVSLFILHVAWKIIRPNLKQLVDTAASKDVCDRILETSLQVEGVRDVHAIRSRYIGPGLLVDLHVLVDADVTVREGHEIGSAVKWRLRSKDELGIVDVIVHVEPYECPGQQQGLAIEQ